MQNEPLIINSDTQREELTRFNSERLFGVSPTGPLYIEPRNRNWCTITEFNDLQREGQIINAFQHECTQNYTKKARRSYAYIHKERRQY